MKGKKLCIGLLIFFTTCLLLLNPSLNASALKNQTLAYRYLDTLNWKYSQSGASAISQTAPAYGNSLIRNISLNASPLTVSYITQPEFVTKSNTTIPLRTDRLYHHTIIFFSEIDRPETTLTSALCPRANNTVIDKCEIKELSRENYIQNITQYPDPNGVGQFYAGIGADANYIQMIEIWGHGKSNQDLTGLTYQNDWLYFIQNTNSILDAPVKLTIYFSPIEIYTEEESATEQEQAQELQDRDNLETQSSTTENQADNAGNAAETTGTTLFGAFSQLFTALTNVNGNNCTLPNMQVYSLNLGQMNLCTYDIPPQIMALVSIGMVFIIVPLGIHLVKRMISLYKEITG
ncbi:MAG: hypothetical protein IJL02_11745 [Methanobrevibacter sp.]|uniref:hypothetical protein n=1 Tax=Methanobrevibacter sp. TaxID=66852 RepID=UPI0025DD27AF|nr:hypothetical protein [Methanobrevibacter sp.]MBQ6100519.1 hypothetical protein [Methanobrevibacter sp.]